MANIALLLASVERVLKIKCMLEIWGFKYFYTVRSPLKYFAESRPGTHVDLDLHVRQGHPVEYKHD